MNRKLLWLLNFCAAFFLPLALLPLLVIYHAAVTGLLFGEVAPLPAETLFLQLLVCELCGFAGKCCGLAVDRWGLSSAPRRVLAVPAGAALAAGIYFLFAWKNPMAAPGMAVLGAAAFWAVGGLRFYTYGEILSLRVFYGYLTEYTVVLIVMELFRVNPVGAAPFAAALFLAMLLVLFGSNQSGIDFMMERRHHRFDSLPQKIRSYNIRLLIAAGGVLLFLLLLYRPIAWLLSASGQGLFAALKWLLGLMPNGGSSDSVSKEPGQGQASQNVLGQLEPGKTSPFWTCFGIVLAIGFVFLLYYYRHEIYLGLRSAWQAIREFFRKMLWGGRQKAEHYENEYYTETDEKIESETGGLQEELSAADRRKWKRACRRFSAEEDSPQAMRTGYRLILQGIALQGVPVAVSNTTLEICQNALAEGLPPIEKCTAGYNRLRYGEQEFDLSSMADIREALSEILRYRKKEG